MYFVVDIETTGLDKIGDLILEVAVVILNEHLETVDYLHHVCQFDPETLDFIIKHSDPYVREMHTKNGLWETVRCTPPAAVSDEEILLYNLKDYLDEEKKNNILVGSGIAEFDRPFMAIEYPRLMEKFYYRSYDIGMARRFLKLSNPEKQYEFEKIETGNHRALEDALNHAEEFRRIINYLSGV